MRWQLLERSGCFRSLNGYKSPMEAIRIERSHAVYATRITWPLFLLGCFTCHASGAPRGTAPAAAGAVDTSASRVFALVGKTGLGHEHGVEGRIRQGHLRLGAKQDAGNLVFEMQTMVADTAAARRFVGLDGTSSPSTRRQVTANMLGPAVLDVKRFPTAQFQIDAAEPIEQRSRHGNPQYVLSGTFRLHGVARPLRLTAEVIEGPHGTRVRGGFVIRQTDYGITPFTKAFGAVGVADRLTIWGDLRIAGGPAARTGRPPPPRGHPR